MTKAPYTSYRRPMVAYVPKWHKKNIKAGCLLAGRVFPSMKIHAWLANQNSRILGIAVSDMKKDRTVEFEQTLWSSPVDIFEFEIIDNGNLSGCSGSSPNRP